MSRELLLEVGEALYGPRWQSDVARDLDVSIRTMQRWSADGLVPDSVFDDLAKIIRDRAKVLTALADRLDDR